MRYSIFALIFDCWTGHLKVPDWERSQFYRTLIFNFFTLIISHWLKIDRNLSNINSPYASSDPSVRPKNHHLTDWLSQKPSPTLRRWHVMPIMTMMTKGWTLDKYKCKQYGLRWWTNKIPNKNSQYFTCQRYQIWMNLHGYGENSHLVNTSKQIGPPIAY